MNDLPNFSAVKLDEAVAKGDEMLGDKRLSDWVLTTNMERSEAQIVYEASSVEIHGVTLVPGQTVVILTIKGPHDRKARRRHNAVFSKQQISRHAQDYWAPQRQFAFRIYGAKPETTWARRDVIEVGTIIGIEVVKAPAWLLDTEQRLKERGW